MPDFGTLLRKPAGQAPKPVALESGNYPGRVKSFEPGNQNKNKTPYIRFHVAITDWPEGAEPQTNDKGEVLDLSKRQFRRDFYLTDDSLSRLDDFLSSLGIELTDRSYEECLPETLGQEVLVEITQYMREDGSVGDQVNRLSGLGA